MLIEAILYGFLSGIGTIIFIGPVFFTVMESAFKFGFRAGWAASWGIIVSDILCILLCMLGADAIMKTQTSKLLLAGIGAILVFVMGVKYFLQKPETVDLHIEKGSWWTFFVKGFLVNFVNPFVFIIWLGFYEHGKHRYGEDAWVYLAAILVGIFVLDTSKSALAPKIRPWLAPAKLSILYKVIGIILCGFGLRLAWVFWGYWAQ